MPILEFHGRRDDNSAIPVIALRDWGSHYRRRTT